MRRFLLLLLVTFALFASPALAADVQPSDPTSTPTLSDIPTDIKARAPITEIHIPGFDPNRAIVVSTDSDGTLYMHLPWIGDYVAALYKYALATISIVAVAMMIRQGFQIIFGGEGQATAYKRIGQIVIAVCLAWGSYTILYFINPQLTKFNALKVEYIEGLPIEEHLGGGGNEDNPVIPQSSIGSISYTGSGPRGRGDIGKGDLHACPQLVVGTVFSGAAFTTYYNLNPKSWGEAGRYRGIYKGTDASLQGKGDFFCAVSMECGCSGVGYSNLRTCSNSKKNWPPCKYFDSSKKFCDSDPKKYIPGKTVAASTCFPKGTQLKVDDHILTVTDRGAGIIGAHFDLYLGVEGDPNFLTDTSWLKTDNIEIVKVGPPIGQGELNRMRNSYARYKPGVCTPNVNC